MGFGLNFLIKISESCKQKSIEKTKKVPQSLRDRKWANRIVWAAVCCVMILWVQGKLPQQTRYALDDMELPEVDYFLEHFLPSFKLTLDELE